MAERGAVNEKGPSIGSYLNRDIPAWIDARGGRYEFTRLWDETRGDIAQLAGDEIVISPGLIYSSAMEPAYDA